MSLATRPPEACFGTAHAVHLAPGRMDLPGQHTECNDGYMPAVATPRRANAMAAPGRDGRFQFPSASLHDDVSIRTLDQPNDMLRKTPTYTTGACVALCHAGTAAAAGRRAVTKVNAAAAAATLLIPASNPSRDHNKRGSDE